MILPTSSCPRTFQVFKTLRHSLELRLLLRAVGVVSSPPEKMQQVNSMKNVGTASTDAGLVAVCLAVGDLYVAEERRSENTLRIDFG